MVLRMLPRASPVPSRVEKRKSAEIEAFCSPRACETRHEVPPALRTLKPSCHSFCFSLSTCTFWHVTPSEMAIELGSLVTARPQAQQAAGVGPGSEYMESVLKREGVLKREAKSASGANLGAAG